MSMQMIWIFLKHYSSIPDFEREGQDVSAANSLNYWRWDEIG